MSQAINGMTTICGRDIPFCFDTEKESITVYTGPSPIEIPEGMNTIVGQKFGMLTGGCTLFKLSVPLSNNCLAIAGTEAKSVSCSNQIREVEYSIDDYADGSRYTEMRLRFPELDYILPSMSRASIVDNDIVFSREKDSVYCFDVNYCGKTTAPFILAGIILSIISVVERDAKWKTALSFTIIAFTLIEIFLSTLFMFV